jgi:hypothetical protein
MENKEDIDSELLNLFIIETKREILHCMLVEYYGRKQNKGWDKK